MDLTSTIRSVPDFPIEGILFYDITTLLQNPSALKESIDRLTHQYENKNIDVVVGMESIVINSPRSEFKNGHHSNRSS